MTPEEYRRHMIAKQAEQDQFWMAYDAWYDEQDPEATIDLINHIDVEPENGPEAIRTLDNHGAELVRRFALHVLTELALRNMQPEVRSEES